MHMYQNCKFHYVGNSKLRSKTEEGKLHGGTSTTTIKYLTKQGVILSCLEE